MAAFTRVVVGMGHGIVTPENILQVGVTIPILLPPWVVVGTLRHIIRDEVIPETLPDTEQLLGVAVWTTNLNHPHVAINSIIHRPQSHFIPPRHTLTQFHTHHYSTGNDS